MDNFLRTFLRMKTNYCFVSPHLDDALLSCSQLISSLSKKRELIVINVFTDAPNVKSTISAWWYLKKLGYKNASILYKRRREEDRSAYKKLHISPINLGFVDALWRKKEKHGLLQMLETVIPELSVIYPTYKYHITTGRLSPLDWSTMKNITQQIKQITNVKNDYIFAPLGIGNHVDHILVHNVCKALSKNIIYYSDFPYNIWLNNYGKPPKGYQKIVVTVDLIKKREQIASYQSQFLHLFPDGRIPYHEEVYFIPKDLPI